MTAAGAAPGGKHTFTTLDALRGVAAFAVVLYHSNTLSGSLFRHGYLAVDFFFVLSGFVLSYAYGDRLASGWPARDFFRVRFIRFFPLSTLGLLMAVALWAVGISDAQTFAHVPPLRVAGIALLNLFLLPGPRVLAITLFPFNPVTWSLTFELFSNAVHVLFLRRARPALLVALAAITGLAYIASVLHAGTADIGYDTFAHLDGFARVGFSYVIGMLLFKLSRRRPALLSVSPAVMCILLTIVLAMPVPQRFTALYDVLCIVVLLPAIVFVSSYGRGGTSYAGALQLMGAASYAIYVLQSPTLSLLDWLSIQVTHRRLADGRPWSALVALPVMLGLSLTADRYLDIPARRAMRRVLS